MPIKRENKFLSLAILCLVVFLIILLQVRYGGPIVNFDKLVNNSIHPTQGFVWNLSIFLEYLFGTLCFSILSVILLILFYFKKKHSHSIFFLAAVLGSLVLGYIFKHIVQRARPQHLISETAYSFPSGHAIQSFILIALLFYFFGQGIKTVYIKRLWATAGVIVILLVAFSRIYLQVHWFSDILGAWALGLAWFGVVAYVHEKYKRIDKKEDWL